ncbi:MAG: FAD-binding oxidoreductase [Phycisphaerales bacterium]
MTSPAQPPPASEPDITFPEVRVNLRMPRDPCVGRVVSSELCTQRKASGFVRHITIDVSGTELEGNLRPGQSFGVCIPGDDDNGKPHKPRLFSVASPTRGEDGQGKVIATTVKRLIDEHWEDHRLYKGVCSNYLCDLQPGDEIRLSGPNGKRFLLPENPENYNHLFFATGTGIAPFRGMALDLLEAGVKSHIHLFMGAPYATDLLYHPFWLDLAERHDNFHYSAALSRERQADDHDPMYVHNRITTELDHLLTTLTSDNTLIYICGVAGMELGVFQELAKHLNRAQLERYLEVDPAAMGDIPAWNRRMIHREIKPTKRVLMEVYA